MQIIKKDRPEQIIEVGDLVTEPDSDVACLVGGELELECRFPYPLISVQTGDVVDYYDGLKSIRRECTLLAKNKDITLTY